MMKKSITVSEKDIQKYTEDILDCATIALCESLGNNYTIINIQGFLLDNIFKLSKKITEIEDLCFICEPEEGTLLWNAIIDNESMILDYYEFDVSKKKLHLYFSYKLRLMDESRCEVSVDIKPCCSEGEEIVDLQVIKTNALLRFTYFVKMIGQLY